MSDQSQGEGWWLASDGKWYPPQPEAAETPPEAAETPAPPAAEATAPPAGATISMPAPVPLPAVGSTAPMSAGPAGTVGLPAGVAVADPGARLGAFFLEPLLALVTLGIGWLIWASMTAGDGQTPAKRLMGQRVVDAQTMRPVGFGKMFWVRGLVAGFVAYFAILFTIGIILFMPFWDARRQNIWDKISGTYVVSDPNDAWGMKPDLSGVGPV
jgi:uncharacterized RDD family membrane protein YckC